MSPILVYFVRPGISYFLASRPSSYLVLFDIWYLMVSCILRFRIPCFLVSRTSWYLGIVGISRFLVFRISWYRILLGIPQILISRASWHLVLLDISHFMMSCMMSCISCYPVLLSIPLFLSSWYFLLWYVVLTGIPYFGETL